MQIGACLVGEGFGYYVVSSKLNGSEFLHLFIEFEGNSPQEKKGD